MSRAKQKLRQNLCRCNPYTCEWNSVMMQNFSKIGHRIYIARKIQATNTKPQTQKSPPPRPHFLDTDSTERENEVLCATALATLPRQHAWPALFPRLAKAMIARTNLGFVVDPACNGSLSVDAWPQRDDHVVVQRHVNSRHDKRHSATSRDRRRSLRTSALRQTA